MQTNSKLKQALKEEAGGFGKIKKIIIMKKEIFIMLFFLFSLSGLSQIISYGWPQDGFYSKEKKCIIITTYQLTENKFVSLRDSVLVHPTIEYSILPTVTPTTYFQIDSVHAQKLSDGTVGNVDTIELSRVNIWESLKNSYDDSTLQALNYYLTYGDFKIKFYGRKLGFIYSNCQAMLRTDDGGMNWTITSPFIGNFSSYPAAFYMFNNWNGDGIIVLDVVSNDLFNIERYYNNKIVKYAITNDYGETWTNKTIDLGFEPIETNVVVSESGQIIITFSTKNDDYEIVYFVYQSMDFGNTFKRMK